MKKILSLLALATATSHAQLSVDFANVKNYTMKSEKEAIYLNGYARVSIFDGSWTLAGCSDHPSETIVQPHIFCPLGTTGYVWRGDADQDGTRDDGKYWSLSQVIKAAVIKPFEANRVILKAGPPSKLKRPIGNFADESVGIYYDIIKSPVKEYGITRYVYTKIYGLGEVKKHSDEFVPGVYTFNVPALLPPTTPVGIEIDRALQATIFTAPEARGYRPSVQGFELLGTRWSKGSQELDPRVLTRIDWAGINTSNTIALDSLYFSMYEAHPQTGDIVSPENIQYPTPDLPFLLDSSLRNFIEIIPFAFKKGDRAVARLAWVRSIQASAIANDKSRRTFDWRCRFVDSYEGHSAYEFPAGTVETLRQPEADFDQDGISNLYEFAFSQDDGDDLSTSQEECADATKQAVIPAMAVDAVTGLASMTVPKRENVGSSILYTVEYTTDGKKWKTITAKDKLFEIVTDNEIELVVRTKKVAPAVLFMRPVVKEWK